MEDREGNQEKYNKLVHEEDEHVKIEEEDDNDDDDDYEMNSENSDKSGSVLAGLNLVLILSCVSLSAEECSNMDEFQEREGGIKHDHKRIRNNNFVAKRNEVNEFRSMERQSSKVNTKIRDSRHCRRF